MTMNAEPSTLSGAALQDAISRFVAIFDGACVLADDAGFDAARAVWNAAADDLRPVLITRPSGAAGVAQAVRFAARTGLPLAVRSGGHSPAGFGTVQGGVVIDLSGMKAMFIDSRTRRIHLQPGLTWGEAAAALHEHGLAITSGDVASVGVGGLTQGGGIGWFVRRYGLAVDRLRAAELVTADGTLLRVSETEHPEVFWALRGAGANLGVITSLEFEAHEAGMVYGGLLAFDASEPAEAARLMGRFARIAHAAPDALTMQGMFVAAPPAPFMPPHLVGKTILMVLSCYSGALDDGAAALAPLRALASAAVDLTGPMPYPVLFQMSEEGGRRGLRHVSRSGFLQELDEAALARLTAELASMPPGLLVQVRPLGGHLARTPQDATAFGHRQAPFLVLIDQGIPDASMEDAARQHVEHLWSTLAPHASGLYGNFASEADLRAEQPVYRPQDRARLARVKATLDPHNLFARNANIRPAAAVSV